MIDPKPKRTERTQVFSILMSPKLLLIFAILACSDEPEINTMRQDGSMELNLMDAGDLRDAAWATTDTMLPASDPVFVPSPPRLRRLTNRQYRNTLFDLFGLSVPVEMALATDTQLHGFRAIAATELSISESEVEAYELSAQWIAKAILDNESLRARLINCNVSEFECIASRVADLGSLVWRRPLSADEIDELMALWSNLDREIFGDEQRLELVISALFQSPNFLFIVEHGEPVPDTIEAWRRTSRELLTATVMLIWDAAPSESLLNRYGDTLYEDNTFDTLLSILLEDDRSRRGLLGFFEEYLQLDRLKNVDKSREKFVLMSDGLMEAMRTEALAMIAEVALDPEKDIRTLLTTKDTYLNWELAQLYGEPSPEGFAPHTFSAQSPRKGFLTTGAFLALNAHFSVTSPTYRGKYVQNRFFCLDVPPPPEGVDTTLEPDMDGMFTTMRQKMSRHNADPLCNSCHQFMDPIGLAFENFDALGIWRTDDQGEPIDPSGEIQNVSFRNHLELIDHLSTQDDFANCVARQFVRYAWQRLELETDEPIIDDLTRAFAESNYRFESLVKHVVTSPAFTSLSEVARD